MIAVNIGDERETSIPNVGQILLQDPETGEERLVDTGSYAFKKWLKEFQTTYETDTQSAFKGGKVEMLRSAQRKIMGRQWFASSRLGLAAAASTFACSHFDPDLRDGSRRR